MKRFPTLKISYKLTLGFLGLTLFPMLVLILYNFSRYTEQSSRQIAESGRYVLHSLETKVNEKLDSVESIIQSLAANGNMVSFLSRSFYGAPSFETYSQTILPLLQGAENSVKPYVQELWLLTENNTIPPGYGLVFPAQDFSLPEFEAFRQDGVAQGWYFSPSALTVNSLESYSQQSFYYIRTIASPLGKTLGYAVAKIDASFLLPDLIYARDKRSAFYLLDEQYHCYLSNVNIDDNFMFAQAQEQQQNDSIYLSVPLSRLSMILGLSILQPPNTVLLQNSFLSIWVISLLSLLFLMLFFSMLRSITTRLRRYAHDIEEIAGDGFRHALDTGPHDEIGEIGAGFNMTLQKINNLMQENIQKETAYKDVQLQALLLQINPHFIYNTLDLFVGKLTLNGQYDVADYMCDFAELLRYNTRTTKMFLPLSEELTQAQNYINLQRCRYGDSIVFCQHVPEDLLSVPVMRFLLQPLVENAFEHGMLGKAPTDLRRLSIGARQCKDGFVLRVRDNGCGISPQQIQLLNERLHDHSSIASLTYENKRRGIGLENISDRLQLFYGQDARLELRSREGRFTSVFILMRHPKEKEDAYVQPDDCR